MSDGWEVEQKYHVHDEKAIQKRLADVGFVATKVEQHTDTYFRHPCRNFRDTDEAFRLRRVNDQACVTYKGPRLDFEVKTRPEIELDITTRDFESWRTMFGHLGFEPVPSVVKQRTIYSTTSADFSQFKVMLDEVQELGMFAEVELLVHVESELTVAAEKISELGALLGLDDTQPKSYLAQLLALKGLE